jgi:branched-chain amino acid transport system substrate-binding protein
MQRVRLAALVVAATVIASACGAAAASPPADPFGVVTIRPGEPINFGFWGVITGGDASLGVDQQNGVEIAIADRGGKLLDRDIRLKAEDGGCSVEGGAAVGTKFAADKSLVGLIGSSCSDETVGGIKSITDAGLTTISGSNTRPLLTFPDRGPEYAGYLRSCHSDAFQGKAVAEFVKNELKLMKAATIHDGSGYAEALQEVFVESFKAIGGEIVRQDSIAKGTTDMKPVLTAIAQSKPDVLYFPVFTVEGGNIAKQAKDVAGLEKTILIGSDGMFSSDFVKAAGPAAAGVYLSSPDFSAFQAGYQDFLQKHRAKFGTPPIQAFHAHAYDAANIMFAAVEKVAVTASDGTIFIPKKALRDAIFATRDHKGLTGNLSCSASGDCGAPIIAVYQVSAREIGGKWPPEKPVWPTR